MIGWVVYASVVVKWLVDEHFFHDNVRSHHPWLADRIVHVAHAATHATGAWPGNAP